MRPVRAPDAAIRPVLQYRLDEGPHVRVMRRSRVRQPVEARHLRPAVVAAGRRAPEDAEAGLLDAFAAARPAEMIEHEGHRAAREPRLELDPVVGFRDVDL